MLYFGVRISREWLHSFQQSFKKIHYYKSFIELGLLGPYWGTTFMGSILWRNIWTRLETKTIQILRLHRQQSLDFDWSSQTEPIRKSSKSCQKDVKINQKLCRVATVASSSLYLNKKETLEIMFFMLHLDHQYLVRAAVFYFYPCYLSVLSCKLLKTFLSNNVNWNLGVYHSTKWLVYTCPSFFTLSGK